MCMKHVLHIAYLFILVYLCTIAHGHRKFDKRDLVNLREEVRHMFQHAYEGYLKYAYPYDELRPLSCDGIDTWGSYSLTLIDALDTLAVMGNYSEFQRVVEIVKNRANFDANINVSVFETNIRIIGGLLSAHLLSHRAGVPLEPGWPCNGPLLSLAEDVARRLLAAFDTTTGMPYGTVNLRHGIPEGETSVTCTAGIGTFILEMGTLSRLTGDPVFEEVAMNALYALYNHRSTIGLVGNHIDVETGRWTAKDSGIGAGVDSYYEYLAKGALLLQRPELMHMFEEGKVAIEKYLKRDDWHMWVSMSKGQVTLPVFQSLEAYWPGVLSLVGDINKAMKTLHNYHQVWKQYGFTPEYYNILQGEAGSNREGYPLRPELVESVMYLYRATGDPYLLEVGKDILRSIQHSAKTSCGYATIKDVRDHRKEDRMESFFLAETTKYLYLLFDPENFIHNRGQHGTVIHMPWGECVIEAGGYIFNTEAHPIDPGALHCCSGHQKSDVLKILRTTDPQIIQGERLSTLRNRTFFSRTVPEHKPVTFNFSSTLENLQEQKEKTEEEKEREEFLKELLSEVASTLSHDITEEKRESLGIDNKSMQQFAEIVKRVREKRDKQKSESLKHSTIEEINMVDSDDIIVPVKQNDQVAEVGVSESNSDDKLPKPTIEDAQTYTPKKIDEVLAAVREAISSNSEEARGLSAILNSHEKNEETAPVTNEEARENNNLHTETSEDITTENRDMENRFIPSESVKKNEQIVSVSSKIQEGDLVMDNNGNLFVKEKVFHGEKSSEVKQSVNSNNERKTPASTSSSKNLKLGEDDVNVDDFSEFSIEEDSTSEVKIADKEDILEYQADDSDRVYRAKNKVTTELQVNLSEKDENGVGSITGGIKKEEEPTCVRQVSHKAQNINQLPKFPFLPAFFTEAILSKMTPRVVFDPQVLSEKLLHQPKYKRNTTWEQNYEILTCPAQPFLQRISISGELYNG